MFTANLNTLARAHDGQRAVTKAHLDRGQVS